MTVLTIYTRGGGKTGTNSWQESITSVGAISYVAMQVYEPAHLRKLRAVHHDLAQLQTYRFLHVPSDYLLLRLASGQCTLSADGRTLELDAEAHVVFQLMSQSAALEALTKATKQLTKARRSAKAAEAHDGDID